MPRDGSLTLSDVRNGALSIVCEPCGLRGQYDVARLTAEHGDHEADRLAKLADCREARSLSVHGRCRAVYEGL